MRIENSISSNIPYATTGKNGVVGDFSNVLDKKDEEMSQRNVVHDRAVDTVNIIGKNAPEEVRKAWVEAAEETGTNGMSVTIDGRHFHIPQMLVEYLNRSFWGGGSPDNLLGDTVESAMSVAQKAIYDIDNPLPGQPIRSFDAQQETKKERAFYLAFIEKLKNLSY